MKSPTRRHAKRIIRSDKRHRETLALFGIVSMLVVACVAFVFRLNGRAQTHEVQVLECPVTGTVAHHHDGSCYDDDGNLICTLPEIDAHVHTDACYDEQTTLVCGLDETPAHYHDESCYDEEGNLICGLDETPGHVHSDACYETTRTLVCGQQETVEHVHGPGCFKTYEVSDTMPAQTFEHVFTDKHDRQVLKVFVDAPEDALPDGATMEAKWVSAKKLDTDLVEKAIAKKTDGKMLDFQAVDITFYDVTGAEIEPKKDVTVTFTSDLIDTDDKPVVVHVESEKEAIARGEAQGKSEVQIEAEVVNQLSEKELKKRDVKLADDELAFDSDQFSTYVLAVTSLQKKMKSTDDSTVTVVVSAPAEAGIPQDASLQVTEIASDTDEYADYQARATQAMGTPDAQVAVARFFDITIVDGEGKAIQPQAPVTVKTKLTDAADLDDAKTEAAVVHFGEQDELMDAKESKGVSTFKTDGFSVYGFVYTVDFHYEVDGQAYEYNLAGGDVVTLSELLQAMGTLTPEAVEQEAAEEPAEQHAAIDLSDPTDLKLFIQQIDSVQFSDESLLAVAHFLQDTTAGELKQLLGVEPEYSEELTDEQIEQMNARELAAPDWALVSLKPFDTEELLTITMKDGQVFTVRVTDVANGHWEVWFDGTLGQSAQNNKFYQGASNVHVEATSGWVTLPYLNDTVNGQKVTAPSQYTYRLNGWYDISSKQWYEPGQQVRINKDTVFYADWVPASYDTNPAGALVSDERMPDVSGFVTTELFDYNELINTNFTGTPNVTINPPNPWWSGNPNTHSETWDANNEFAFISWNYNWNPNRSIGMPGNRTDSSEYLGKALSQGIYGRNEDTIKKLFNSDPMVGKTVVGSGDHLFQYNEDTGYYYYDSGLNAATYDIIGNADGSGRFYVYDGSENLTHDNNGTTQTFTNFLPFNNYPGGSAPAENTGATNYWFGMKNTIDFYLPDDVNSDDANKVKNPKTGAKEDMVFKFSGDDDVWVFVDGKLVLDLGGIHDRAGGTIDFSTGEVTTYFGEIDKPVAGTTKTSVNANLKSLEAGNHKIEVLYLERGSSLSNCAIYFNLLPQPKTLDVAKKLVGLTPTELEKYKNETFTVEILIKREDDDSVHPYNTPTDPKERQKAIYHKQDGSTERIVITNGQVTLKHGEYVTIPDLDRYDSLYVAEEKGLNMNQFETPHAERNYHDAQGVEYEEEVNLTQSHSDFADVDDWITPVYTPNETERVTFTNTLKERELEVVKEWKDEETNHATVKFTVEAKDADGQLVSVDVLKNSDGTDKEFELNDGNGWKQVITQLPVMTPGNSEGKEITYTVNEVAVPNYTSETSKDATSKCSIDAFKLWPDDAANHTETIKIKLKRSDGKYYTGGIADGKPEFKDASSAKEFELKPGNGYEYRFMDMPADATYEVEEVTDSGAHTHGVSWYRREIIDWTITNTPKHPGEITVEKKWMDSDGVTPLEDHPESIQYTVYQFSHVHEWGKFDGETWVRDGWIRDAEPTEDTEGHEYQICKYDSSHKNERVLAKLDHVHNWEVTVVEPTCTEQGYTLHECAKDSTHNYKDSFTNPKGHTWDAGTVTREASCTEPGLLEYTCSVCGAKKIEVDPDHPALGHNWDEWVFNSDTDDYTVYERECSTCHEKEEKQVEKPKNVYPGTSAPVDAITNWPTPEQYPVDSDGHTYPNSNTPIKYSKSGIFEFNGNYYVIYNDIPEQPANNFMQPNAIENLIGSNNMCRLSGTVYHPSDYPGKMNASTIKAGDVYETEDGRVYVFVEKNDKNDFAPPPNPKKPNHWYLAYDPGTGSSNNASGNAQNTLSNTSNTKAVQKSLLRRFVDVLTGSEVDDGQKFFFGRSQKAPEKSASVINTDLTKEELMKALGVKELGKKDETTGNILNEYAAVGQAATRTLQTPKGSDASWSETIEVPLEDPNDPDVKYTYYVVETDPAGDSTAWDTTYEGQDEGLGDKGKVTITNSRKKLNTSISILKKDNKGNGLAGAVFTLQKKENNEYQDIKSIKKSETDDTPKYEDVSGIDGSSSFTSATNEVTISNLPDGEYKLIEDSAPGGYVVTNKSIEFSIENGVVVGTDSADGKVQFNKNGIEIVIVNEPGAELPAAGGPGPMLVNILAFTMISAVIFTYALRGKRQYAYARATSGHRPARRGTPRRDSRR